MLHFYAHTLYSMLLSFSYRYYVLNYQAPSMNKIKLIILLIYVPSFIQMVHFHEFSKKFIKFKFLLFTFYQPQVM
ncbi:hypothetical protein OSTOST_08992, partial [Ostertagia ostertagi]